MFEKDLDLIKNHFYASNLIVLYQMFFSEVLSLNEIDIEKLKKYNPGHLGSSISMNFILSNLYYYLNKNKIQNKIVIGAGHSGASLSSQSWLNGSWEEKNNKYSRNIEGLNNLIKDFGTVIRSEINPQYPNRIYDGGELGYALATAYGYAIDAADICIPCIIGDGELETGTAFSSLQLNKMLNVKGKVLPIVNLNGLKMGSSSFLSKLNDNEMKNLFLSLGYDVLIVDIINKSVLDSIETFQQVLEKSKDFKAPLIIVKSKKGFSLPSVNGIKFEGNKDVHKNPLSNYDEVTKLKVLKSFLEEYGVELFDKNGNLLKKYDCFKIKSFNNIVSDIDVSCDTLEKLDKQSIKALENYLLELSNKNDLKIFSPDELFSNQLEKLEKFTFELLNENILQALYQGYTQFGKRGLYIGYEGFMPIISGMVTQYYKYLTQAKNEKIILPSMTYILTSTCWENTYSHQNPDFVNCLLEKSQPDLFSVMYPKNSKDLIECVSKSISSNNKINVITTSKRYKSFNGITSKSLDGTVIECDNPEIIICATGDYLFVKSIDLYVELLKNGYQKIKVNYVTNPNFLKYSTDEDFYNLFDYGVPIIYLFAGYSMTVKSLLFERNVKCKVLGYDDGISALGDLQMNFDCNGLNKYDIIKICDDMIKSSEKRKVK